MKLKNFAILLAAIVFLATVVNCQNEDEEDEEEYDEEVPDNKVTKATKAPVTVSTGKTNSNSTKSLNGTATEATTLAPKRRIRTTESPDESEIDDVSKSVNGILSNIGKGNITGIIDMALTFDTPPAVRELVNGIMKLVFGAGQVVTSTFVGMFTTPAPKVKVKATAVPIKDPVVAAVIGSVKIPVPVPTGPKAPAAPAEVPVPEATASPLKSSRRFQ